MMQSRPHRWNTNYVSAWCVRAALCTGLLIPQLTASNSAVAQPLTVDLRNAVVIVPTEGRDIAERTAVQVLTEEIQRRSTVALRVSEKWTAELPIIVVAARGQDVGRSLPPLEGSEDPSGKAEGYLLQVEAAAGSQPVVWIVGADPRGTL